MFGLKEIGSAGMQSLVEEPIKHVGNAGSMATVAAVGPTGIEIASIVVGFVVSGLIAYSKLMDIRNSALDNKLKKIELARVDRREEDEE